MIGSQTPRIQIEPDRSGTDGEGAALLMSEYGVKLDEWQKLVLDSILGTDSEGNYVTTSAGLSVPRQNGKNVVAEARVFFEMIINGGRVLWTSHQVRTSKKAFRRLSNMFTDRRHPEITQTVKRIRQQIGEESIELENGGLVEFTARSRQAARGFDGISLVIYDEAQELTDEQAEALMSVLSASATGTRQSFFLGTPPYIGCTGEVFRRFRQNCIVSAGKGENTKNSWHEWSIAAEDLKDMDLSDRRLWYESNPALGTRLTEEFTEAEYKTLDMQGFARERLGYWAKPATAENVLAIDPALWDSCASEEPRPEGKTAYAVQFVPDGSEVVLAGAVISTTGKARIALIDIQPTGRGLSWLAEWLNARYKEACVVVIDGKNGSDVLIEKLRPSGGGAWAYKDSIYKPKGQDIITAANMLINDLNEKAVTWYIKQEELRESAITAIKRPIYGGWGFGGQTSAPIQACSLALWGCRTSKRNPQRRMLIG